MFMNGIEFILGLVIGLLADWYIKPKLAEVWSSLERRIKKCFGRRHREAADEKTIFLGERDTGVCLVNGDGESEYSPRDLHFSINAVKPCVEVADFLRPMIEEVKKEEERKKAAGLPYAWNGKMMHIENFADQRSEDEENPRLHVSFQFGEYYHFLATSGRLHKKFNNGHPESDYFELRKLLIGDFNNWREVVPPNCLTGLPANIHIFVDDGMNGEALIFSKRSSTVAIAPYEIAAAINENVHPERDFTTHKNSRLDIGAFLARALKEETGWDDSEHSGDLKDPKSEMHWILFAADTHRVAYGLIGYVKLPITFSELQSLFNEKCADRREINCFLKVRATTKSVCEFVHSKDLYNSVGVGALYSLAHRKKTPLSDIQKEIRRLQKG
jgi:hypothetical protein